MVVVLLLLPSVEVSVSDMHMNPECYEVSCASGVHVHPWLGTEARVRQHMNTSSDDMSGPVASNLVLLSDLETTAQGTKVRFLGWY